MNQVRFRNDSGRKNRLESGMIQELIRRESGWDQVRIRNNNWVRMRGNKVPIG